MYNESAGSVKNVTYAAAASLGYQSPELYYRYAMFSAMAYCDQGQLQYKNSTQPLLTGNYNVVSVYSEDDSQFAVFAQTQSRELVVAFRGSNNFGNYLDDADLIPAFLPATWFLQNNIVSQQCTYSYQLLYGGYLNSVPFSLLQSLYTTIVNFRQQHPDYSVVLVGHSLGESLL